MSNPNRPRYRTLSEYLEQLERDEPTVRAASEAYDRVSEEIRRTGARILAAERQRLEEDLRLAMLNTDGVDWLRLEIVSLAPLYANTPGDMVGWVACRLRDPEPV